jgi:transcription-repair coupling factor (superfamily II helicase)
MNSSLTPLLNRLQQTDVQLHLDGLRGSSKALMLALLQQTRGVPMVVVCESYEIAEQFHADLTYFRGRERLHFFPHWDVLPYDNFSPHRALVAERFRTLQALLCGQVDLVVTTPHALMQKLMPRDRFRKAVRRIAVGSTEWKSLGEFVEQLRESGYVAVDTVEDQGEFSWHGAMLDLFPIGSSRPRRLESQAPSGTLEFLTIRPFDVQTQLTGEETVEALELLPASEVLFTVETQKQSRHALSERRRECSPEVFRELDRHLREASSFPGMESLAPLFFGRLETLLDYLPENAQLVFDEEEVIHDRAEHFYSEVFMEYELSLQQERLTLPPEDLFMDHRELRRQATERLRLTLQAEEPREPWGERLRFPFSANRHLREGFRESASVSASGHAVHQLAQWQQQNIPVLLNGRNQTHSDHFRLLLEDLDIESHLASDDQTPRFPWGEALLLGRNAPGTSAFAGTGFPILSGTLSSGFQLRGTDGTTQFALVTEEEVFGEKSRSRRLQRSQVQATAGSLDDLRENDLVVHLDHGIGRYRGLQKIEAAGKAHEFMLITFARDEKVYVPIGKFHLVQKYVNPDGGAVKLHKLGDKAWKKTRTRVAKAVEDIAEELAEIYAKRKARRGIEYAPDDHEMQEFELGFPYEETPDQLEAIEQVKSDMHGSQPMDRLICGDVGFGKTEIAMRAAFKAASQGKQVAILVPTTILAQQHFASFRKRFENTAFLIDVISRFRSTQEQKETLRKLKEQQLDILIGTHRILSQDVQFADLGLLIVDEEQRFGVKHKERIKQFRSEVDVLTLSATPIPRTLHLSLMGIRDLSIINTPPADRMSIRTRLVQANDYIIQEAVGREIRRGGQVFVVHNRVETIYEYGNYLRRILPNVRVAVGHGQMGEQQLEQVMLDFIEGRADVLLATTIIESGLDIPRANTIIVNNADHFGLAQLYQLRGRVGRSNVQAYAYLLVSPEKILSSVARERLQVLQDLNDLGAGFKVASRDLEIRGAGNLLGSEQSGHIASVGLELYTQMVERAVRRLQNEGQMLLEADEIRLNLDHIPQEIPESYIRSTNQRLSLYKALAGLPDEEAVWELRNATENRFGPMPELMLNLFKVAQVRLWSQQQGVALVEYRQHAVRLQLRDPQRINADQLIAWLSEPDCALRYIPENTLEVRNVSADIDDILFELRQLDPLFTSGTNALPLSSQPA